MSGHRIQADFWFKVTPKLTQIEENARRKAGMQNALQTESDRFSMTTYPAEVPYRTKLIEI